MVKIYSIPECPYCNELKQYLDSDGIKYIDVDVNLPEHQDEYDKICEITKSDMVPIVRVGTQLLVPNVSFQTIAECFEITRRFLH